MKKHGLLFVLLAIAVSTVYASPVDRATANKAARQFLHSMGMSEKGCNVTDISSSTPFNNFYVFDINNGEGFVVISGDDNTEPILAYSLTDAFPTTEMPKHIRLWYEGYEAEVEQNSKSAKSPVVKEHWKRLMEGKCIYDSKELISSILKTQWDQDPYYNQLCPYDSNARRHTPSGCTATATAQIMKAFNYPTQGYGSETFHHYKFGNQSADYGNTFYQWDTMPKRLNQYSNETQVNAVAELIYHAGVAVHMAYSIGGSGGKTASYGYGGEPSSENALKYNFKYSPYIWTAFRIDYTIEQWSELMLSELRAGRPILYAGYDEVQSGHAFVLDGYNSNNDCFHINWGWGGSYDAYYKLHNLNPASGSHNSGYHFDLFATATIGIEPYDDFEVGSTTNVTVSAIGDGSVTGSGTYNFGDTITMTATVNSPNIRFVQWSDGCRYNPRSTVATGGELSFTAQFEPLHSDTLRYHTCDNAMNRASNLPDGLGRDSVWGIRIPAAAIRSGAQLKAVRFMGRRAATHTLTILCGTDSPETELYSATFFDSLDYPYTYYQHDLSAPITPAEGQSLWIVLKCTEIDTPAVFSIYGGNPYSMLSGANLTEMSDQWKFSWMIEGLFTGNAGINDVQLSTLNFQIYPNPASDRITLGNLPDNAKVEIVDINGREVFATHSAGNELTIDNAHLTPGIYLVRITSDKGIGTQRLVVK